MTTKRWLSAIGIILAASAPVFANQIKEMSLADKASHSDLVAIARVQSLSDTRCGTSTRCAGIEVLRVLQGKNVEEPLVLFDGEIAEENPACCVVGHYYLFFLKLTKTGFYESVNGPYGIYELPASKPSS